MPARPVAMPVTAKVVRVTAAEIIAATKLIATVATVIVPWSGAVAERFVCAADEREAADRLPRLLAALAAGNELKDVAHRHALFGACATSGTNVFVQSHIRIVAVPRSAVNPGDGPSLRPLCLRKPTLEKRYG